MIHASADLVHHPDNIIRFIVWLKCEEDLINIDTETAISLWNNIRRFRESIIDLHRSSISNLQ